MSNSVPNQSPAGEIRVFQPETSHRDAVARAVRAAFGMLGEMTFDREHYRPQERRLAVAEGDNIIGGCFAYPFRMSLPGGVALPVAGLGGVGISPAAQGRGAFRPMMEAHLRQSAALGDAASILMASESGLYRRFGYGQATDMAVWQLDTRAFALRDGVDPRGTLVLLDNTEDDIAVVASVHDAACGRRGGDVFRSEAWWLQIVGAKEKTWFGGGDQFVALWRDADGDACAYALYTLEDVAEDAGQPGTPKNRLCLRELVADSARAEVGLFAALCGISWVREIMWELAPVDPPVRHAMVDPRELRQVRRLDMSWMRPLDPIALLQNRHYLCDGAVCMTYVDPLFPELDGSIDLVVEGGVAAVTRGADSASDAVALDPATLGMILLGGTRVLELADVEQLTGPSSALAMLDRLLAVERAPFNLTKF